MIELNEHLKSNNKTHQSDLTKKKKKEREPLSIHTSSSSLSTALTCVSCLQRTTDSSDKKITSTERRLKRSQVEKKNFKVRIVFDN